MRFYKLNSRIRYVYYTFIFMILYSSLSFSQEKTIQIINQETKQPVKDIFYNYHNESGFSNTIGQISILPKEEGSLFLSHIQFGKVEIDSEDLKMAFEKGFLEVQFITHQLSPVAVYRIHPEPGESNYLDVSTQDKLEHDAGDLVTTIAGISSVRKSAAYGFDPVLRGFKYDQLNLVIDGVQTASAACPNRMDPASSQIPVNMITEVEVLKGPYSLRYGNAFGGTLNFNSSRPEFSEKFTPVGRIGTSYESNGNVFRTEGVAGLRDKSVDFRVFGSYSTGKDYKDGEGVLIPAEFYRLNWGTKIGFKLGEKQRLGILLSNNRAKDVDFPSLPMDLRDDNTWLLNGTHTAYFFNRKITSWNTTMYFTKVNHLMDNYDKIINPRMVDAETDASTLNFGGRTEIRFDFGNNFLYTGVDFRSESSEGERTRKMLMGPMTGNTLYDNVWQDAKIIRSGIFAEYHWGNETLNGAVSGRLDYNEAESDKPDSRFSSVYPDLNSAYLNPSISFGGTKRMTERASIGLWLGRAKRSPSISERYINFFPVGVDPYEMLGNPQLKPETNNQADLVFQFNSPKTNINLDMFVSFLRNYISSEIDPDLSPAMATSPGVRKFTNIDKAFITGFEFVWKQQISANLKHDLSIFYTYGEDQNLNEPLPEIPPLEIKYALKGSFLKNKILPEILIRQTLKQDRIAVSYGETETPAFNVVDFKLTYLPVKKVSFTAGILNVFDVAYYEHLARSVRDVSKRPIYSPGRSFYFTATINFM